MLWMEPISIDIDNQCLQVNLHEIHGLLEYTWTVNKFETVHVHSVNQWVHVQLLAAAVNIS